MIFARSRSPGLYHTSLSSSGTTPPTPNTTSSKQRRPAPTAMNTTAPSTAFQRQTAAPELRQTEQASRTTAQLSPATMKYGRALPRLASLYHSLAVLLFALHLIFYSLLFLQPSLTDSAERARVEYDSMLNETVKEEWVRSTLPQLYEQSLLRLPWETHKECLSRGALYAHNYLGRYYMDYADVCDSTVDWVQSNCDTLFWTPQVVVTLVVDVQHLTGWARRKAFVKHHTQKLWHHFKGWISTSFPPDVPAQSVTSPTPKPAQRAKPRPFPLPAHFRIVDCTENPPCKLLCIPTSKAASTSPSQDMLEAAERRAELAQRLAKRGDLSSIRFGVIMLIFTALALAVHIAGHSCAARLGDGWGTSSKTRILRDLKWEHSTTLLSILPYTWCFLRLFGIKLSDYEPIPSIGLVGGYVLLALWILPLVPFPYGVSLLLGSLREVYGLWRQDLPQSELVELEKKSILPTSTLQEDIAATLHNMRVEAYNQSPPPSNDEEAATSSSPPDVDLLEDQGNTSTHGRLGVTTAGDNDFTNTQQDEASAHESFVQSTPTISPRGSTAPSIVVQPPQGTIIIISPPQAAPITDQTTSNPGDPQHNTTVPAPRTEEPSSDNASSLSPVSLPSCSTGRGSDWSVVLPPTQTAAVEVDDDAVVEGPVVMTPRSDSSQDVPQLLADAMRPVDGEEEV